ncbi:hypothetical protein I6I20_02960 [Lactococcus garvieae]|uniref:hypothetical protein n=1 Tax=Lactococcus sp. DD01 TaxID=1776443 RepID=UPI0007769DF4|nr:hypothetical protein [Lactococcus sp. DD01]KXT61409.1 hypothetical protein LACDD01_01422 [Lactococcus sp. DD01]QQC73741.1 hypothetical protein I6I20_02960 [Lactococcus garvieae]
MAIPKSAYTAAMAQSHIDYVKPLVVTDKQYYRFLDWCDKENKPNNPMHFLAVIIGCPLEKAISYHRGEMTLEEVKNVKSK